uniref:Uncharacterized protein n=1 Tax=Anguilla anguilla TaxID=7936 RepID=A0A0E9WHW6_ANGAN
MPVQVLDLHAPTTCQLTHPPQINPLAAHHCHQTLRKSPEIRTKRLTER